MEYFENAQADINIVEYFFWKIEQHKFSYDQYKEHTNFNNKLNQCKNKHPNNENYKNSLLNFKSSDVKKEKKLFWKLLGNIKDIKIELIPILKKIHEISKYREMAFPWKNIKDPFIEHIEGLNFSHAKHIQPYSPVISYIIDLDGVVPWSKSIGSVPLPKIHNYELCSKIVSYIEKNFQETSCLLPNPDFNDEIDYFMCRRALEDLKGVWDSKEYLNRKFGDNTINEGTFLRDFDFILKLTAKLKKLNLEWAEKMSTSSEFRLKQYNRTGKKPDAMATYQIESNFFFELLFMEAAALFLKDDAKKEGDRTKLIRLANDSKYFLLKKINENYPTITLLQIKELMEVPVICYQFYGSRLKIFYFDQPYAYKEISTLIPIGRVVCIEDFALPLEQPEDSADTILLIRSIFRVKSILENSIKRIKKVMTELKTNNISSVKIRSSDNQIYQTTVDSLCYYDES
ncbi:hypothetical protein Glove_642g18 [Diversispora epigaea]|uniref:Uncharacterized protein n=1 Tax=Diversispora epigaea TaxID=1348612 RepID=A0A397GAE0_9GLOM|nr:hypothetical protein Glove_642g18 [Diversispora epigaea]